jgi:putative ABC transport system permease protein
MGASNGDIIALVLKMSLRPTFAGIIVGLGVGALLVRSLHTLVYGIYVWDLASLTLAPVALFAVAIAASYAPARRAIGIDPVTALRSD